MKLPRVWFTRGQCDADRANPANLSAPSPLYQGLEAQLSGDASNSRSASRQADGATGLGGRVISR
ncbi:MAG: hypothetical protein CFE44_21465 [Burkholderiales bacterium PBB4]|nr:MAG: hypothetical protein CFE44_21465 [Burkholderiales bacterium PBB4]